MILVTEIASIHWCILEPFVYNTWFPSIFYQTMNDYKSWVRILWLVLPSIAVGNRSINNQNVAYYSYYCEWASWPSESDSRYRIQCNLCCVWYHLVAAAVTCGTAAHRNSSHGHWLLDLLCSSVHGVNMLASCYWHLRWISLIFLGLYPLELLDEGWIL